MQVFLFIRVKYYNLKAWNLKSNTEMDYGFEATVKRKPLETGSRYEFPSDHINAYPIAHDGYNKFFVLVFFRLL